jgi:hypothetical protein
MRSRLWFSITPAKRGQVMLEGGRKVERRMNTRFRVRSGTFAVLSPDSNYSELCEIIDISRGGLSFRHTERNKRSKPSYQLCIMLKRGGFRLEKVFFKTVSDIQATSKSGLSSEKSRRCSVKFEKLTHDQKFELEHFMRNYTFRRT